MGEHAEAIEYRDYVIYVRPRYVDDGAGNAVAGYAADVRQRDGEATAPDGHDVWRFPFDLAECTFDSVGQDDAISQAKAFIDAGGKASRPL